MATERRGGRGKRWVVGLLLVLVTLAVATWAAFRLSPWPSVLLIRWTFDRGAAETSAALQKHLPAGVSERRGLAYDPRDPEALLDVYYPPEGQRGA